MPEIIPVALVDNLTPVNFRINDEVYALTELAGTWWVSSGTTMLATVRPEDSWFSVNGANDLLGAQTKPDVPSALRAAVQRS